MTQGLVLWMYARTMSCGYLNTARRVLHQHKVAYEEVLIDQDRAAYQQVLAWTGFASVPTLVLCAPDERTPLAPPTPLAAGQSPQGVDRGYMITEPHADQLEAWLRKHGLIAAKVR